MCKKCPISSTYPFKQQVAPPGSVSVNACYENCSMNRFFERNERGTGCLKCPLGHRSEAGSIGIKSCEKVICPANEYFVTHPSDITQNICKPCPSGKGHAQDAPYHLQCRELIRMS